MNSVHIPNNNGYRVIRVNTCGDLWLDFAECGEFKWMGEGREFNPHLPQRRIEAGKLGPFVAPNHEVEVHWTFTQSPSGKETTGLIQVVSKAETSSKGGDESSSEQREEGHPHPQSNAR